jgi:NADH-quinone oxidoreductase subunit F
MKEGYRFRGLLPGGTSTDFLTEEHFDTPMDFVNVQKAGSRLGTGTMIVLDDQTCPVGMVYNLEAFFAQESCGWCTPCREGLPYVREILTRIEQGEGVPEDIEILREHVHYLNYTFCALAPGAMGPVEGLLRLFEDELREHINKKKCPFRTS